MQGLLNVLTVSGLTNLNEDYQQRAGCLFPVCNKSSQNEKVQQTYFTWDFSGEIAVGGEFEATGVLGRVVDNVNVSRLPAATDRKTDVT